MKRIITVTVLVLAALLIELLIAYRMPDFSEGGAAEPEMTATLTHQEGLVSSEDQAVFCQSILHFSLPRQRWNAYIKHPQGGRDAIDASIRGLPQLDIPDPWPASDMLEHYEILHTVCFDSWDAIFQVTDSLYRGRASRLLEASRMGVSEEAKRRAVLEVYFDESWEMAARMFPLADR